MAVAKKVAPKKPPVKKTAPKKAAPKKQPVKEEPEVPSTIVSGIKPFDADEAEANRPKHIEKEQIAAPVDAGGLFPIVKLLQDLSPELDEDEEKYVDGASAGDIVVTDGTSYFLLDDGLIFIPIAVRKQWTEWIPRKQGGGFVDSYSSKEDMEIGYTQGNDVQVTIDYLVVTQDISPPDENDFQQYVPVMLQFNSPTKLAIARNMADYIAKFQTMYGVAYRLTSNKKKNRAGQKYYNYAVEALGWVDENMYETLESLKEQFEEQFENPPAASNDGDDDEDM